uniref:Uncharacterized protein n=1 Tax=viral metagenome TaxID=1070528 RepID=A0A6C0BKL7_9ZZZZ
MPQLPFAIGMLILLVALVYSYHMNLELRKLEELS